MELTMKFVLTSALVAMILSGCVVVPVGPPGSGAYAAAPAGVVVRPAPVVIVRPYYYRP
jgi:hypothetical protein